MIKTLYIFRHGETDWNRDMRMQGGTDISLNEEGRSQARRLADFFKKNPVEIFLSSDLERAKETAQIASGLHLGLTPPPIVLDARLRETNLGEAEGLTQSEFIQRFGIELLEAWRTYPDLEYVRFPQGESKAEHRTRVLNGIQAFLHSSSYLRIGVATHGGSMRRLIHHWCPDLESAVMVGNCVVYKVIYDQKNQTWTVDLNPLNT